MTLGVTRRGLLRATWHVGLGYALASVLGYEYASHFEPRWLSVEHLEFPIGGLPPVFDGFRLVCLADIHLRSHQTTEWIGEVVNTANQLGPDLICLLGDYVLESAETIHRLAPVLAELRATYGVLCVLGNHDLWTDRDVVTVGLENAGLRVLVNEGVLLESGGQSIFVAGLDDGWSGKPDLAVALRDSPPDAAIVLMMHEPDFADDISADGRVALQLSGHSHGGQVRLPVIGAPILPEFGRKYDQGLHRVNGMWLYTTRGIGSLDPPLRFNCRPEISELTLVGEPSS